MPTNVFLWPQQAKIKVCGLVSGVAGMTDTSWIRK